MNLRFQELDYRPTAIGPLTLRRRYEPVTGSDVYEILLGDEHLMSSLFIASELALARLGLAALPGSGLEVAVGGLGLGYTALTVLEDPRVHALRVVEMLEPVIEWHRDGLLPLGPRLTGDPRCRFVQGDFFAMMEGAIGCDPDRPGARFDAILVDIDHSPDALLDARSSSFYRPAGLMGLQRHLKPGGIFGLWSNQRADPMFTERLAGVFAKAWAEPVTFWNPLQNTTFTQTIYLARAADPRQTAPEQDTGA